MKLTTSIDNKIKALSKNHLKLGKDAFWVLAMRGVQRLLGLATIYVLVRTLDQATFGTYQFILSMVGIFTITVFPGLQNAVMQSVSRGYGGTYKAALPWSLAGSSVGALLLFGAGCWYLFDNSHDIAQGLFVAAVIFPLAHGLTNWRGVFAGKEDFAGIFKIESAFAALMALFIIGLSLLYPGEILIPLAVVLAGRALQNIYATILAFKCVEDRTDIEPTSITYGLKTTINAFINEGAKHIDKILLFFFLSPAATALYFAADRIADLIKSTFLSLGGVLGPRFARHKHYAAHVDRALKLVSIVSAATVVIFAFTLLPWVMDFLFGAEYSEAIPYAQALLCISTISFYTGLRNRFIRSRLDAKSLGIITFSAASSRILTSLALVPLYGIPGAVIATLIQAVIGYATVHVIMIRKYPIQSQKTTEER